MDALFNKIGELSGASVDQIKLITCLIVSFPLGNLFVRTPPHLKHWFNIAVALFFFFPMLHLRLAFVQLLGEVLLTYGAAKYNKSSKMPWLVFLFTMSHLMINHIIRYWSKWSYETLEVTTPQMVLTMKLTTFAWNVYDGRRPSEELDKWQTAKRVVEYPSLVEFLGYCFYFPTTLVGPYLDFAEYMDLVNETTLKDAADKSNSPRKIPVGRKRHAYYKMVSGLAFLGIFVVFGGKWNFSAVLTPEFLSYGMLKRIVVFQFYGFFERSKYYAIWSFTEGASVLTGAGFSGFSSSGQPQWYGAANLTISTIEFAPNFKVLVDSWNMKANVWLRECVYKRVTPKGKKPGFKSSMLTFATSAIWHGVAAGYYLCFFFAGFITTAGRLVRANIRPLLLPEPGQQPSTTKRIYDLAGTLASILCINYTTCPFMLLTVKDTLVAWMRLGFYGHVMIGGTLTFFYTGGTKFFRTMQNKQEVAAASARAEEYGSHTIPPPLDGVVPPPSSR